MTQMEASSHLDTGYVGPQIEVPALLSQSSGARNVGPAVH